MFCAFATFVVTVGGIGVLAWFGWQRVSDHLKNNPAAARLLAEHVVTPLLVGEKEPNSEDKPEPKKIKATLI